MEFEKIRDVIVDVLSVDAEEVTPEKKFVEDLGADSLDIFQIIMGIEDEFNVEIDNDEAENLSTVGDAVAALTKLING
ncbi:MAG: acyl carrier protein [Dorea sp.]|nr:acyl carrier protein [Dorea sp.]